MNQITETLEVPFSTVDAGEAPLTWGQKVIWRPIQAMPESSSSFNIKRTLSISDGISVPLAVSSLRWLIERHQALRAHFHSGEPPRQVVEKHGTHRVGVLDVPAESIKPGAETVALDLASTPFDLEKEWALRVVFVRSGGLVRSIAMAASHVGVDSFAFEALLTDFRQLLSGPSSVPDRTWQPLDQARYEMSPSGMRRGQKALDHWRRSLPTVPPSVFDRVPSDGGEFPIQTWRLKSPALVWAARVLAEQTRTSSSTVLLAACAMALHAASLRDRVVLKLIAGNRYSAQQKSLIAPNCGNGIFTYTPQAEDSDVSAAIVRCHKVATESYLNSYYDSDALQALSSEVERERGSALDLSAYFNDARLGREWPTVEVDPSRPAVERLRAQSRLVPEGGLAKHDMTFCLTASSSGNVPALSLLADIRWLPPELCRLSLRAVETILCEAALRSVRLSEIPTLTGLVG